MLLLAYKRILSKANQCPNCPMDIPTLLCFRYGITHRTIKLQRGLSFDGKNWSNWCGYLRQTKGRIFSGHLRLWPLLIVQTWVAWTLIKCEILTTFAEVSCLQIMKWIKSWKLKFLNIFIEGSGSKETTRCTNCDCQKYEIILLIFTFLSQIWH